MLPEFSSTTSKFFFVQTTMTPPYYSFSRLSTYIVLVVALKMIDQPRRLFLPPSSLYRIVQLCGSTFFARCQSAQFCIHHRCPTSRSIVLQSQHNSRWREFIARCRRAAVASAADISAWLCCWWTSGGHSHKQRGRWRPLPSYVSVVLFLRVGVLLMCE